MLVCGCVCVYVCVYVCMYVCMYVCNLMQGHCTPMEALESIPFTQEGRIAAQLSRSLIMKGWKHVDDSLRRRPPPVEDVGRASKRARVEA